MRCTKREKKLFSTLNSVAIVKLQLWVHCPWVELPHHVSTHYFSWLFLSTHSQMLPQFLFTRYSLLFMFLAYSQKFSHSLIHMFFLLLCTPHTPIRHHLQKGASRRYNSPFLQAIPNVLRGGSEAISYTWLVVWESNKIPSMEMQLCLRGREVNGLNCKNVKFRLQLTPGLPLTQDLSSNPTCITSVCICMCECIHCLAGD